MSENGTIKADGAEQPLKTRDIIDEFAPDDTNASAVSTQPGAKYTQFAEPDDIVNGIISGKILDIVSTDKQVEKQLDEHAKSTVMGTIKNKSAEQKVKQSVTENRLNEVEFERTKTACRLFAISEKSPRWQQRMMSGWHNVLFVIWYVLCLFTISPIMFISFRIKNIIKYTWVTVLLAIVIYAAIIFIPLLLKKFSII